MDEHKKNNEANLELLEKVIELAKKHNIKTRITCGVVSIELNNSES